MAFPKAVQRDSHLTLVLNDETQRTAGYTLTELLGVGGSGSVYAAHKVTEGESLKQVALKIVHKRSDTQTTRPLEEAELMRGFAHPAIPSVHESGATNDYDYFAMDLVTGWNLKALLKQNKPLPLRVAVDIAIQLCAVLEYIHGNGPQKPGTPVIHCDIKPSNVMIDPKGQVHLIDFGISCGLKRGIHTGISKGTAAYMAPEQITGNLLDDKTDLFCFGTLLFEMIAGKRLFSGRNIPQLLQDRLRQSNWPKPKRMQWIRGAKSGPLDPLIRQCVSHSRADRPDSASSVLRTLKQTKRRIRRGPSLKDWLQQSQSKTMRQAV
jgi:serine/threonine-protein kinase